MPFLGKTPQQFVDPEVDIDGGSIDGTTIGATSASTATVTTFTSTGIDDNATGERLEVNDGNVVIKANSGSNSHAFGYNEDGGEIILYDEAGSAATLIDQAVNNTRVLELINGSDLLVGLGGSNSTGAIKFMGPSYSVKARIDGDGLKFNADTAAANALDDYEEGTWTPTVYAQNGTLLTSGTDYSVYTAVYTKVGNLVHVVFRIEDLRSVRDQLRSTIPFTSAYSDYSVGVAIPYTTTYGAGEIFMESGGTRIIMRHNLGNQQYKFGTFTYLTAS